jgi:hypothetical protein
MLSSSPIVSGGPADAGIIEESPLKPNPVIPRHKFGEFVLLSAIAAAAGGQAELELVDGRVLVGSEVRQDGDVYVLTLENGESLTFPLDLVETVRLFQKGEPTPAERLEVLGKPARFQRAIVDSSWTPKSDWDMDPEKQNNFRPSAWQESPIDSSWTPTSGFDESKDVMAEGRSTWQKGRIDSSWMPTDGFKDSVGRK